MRGDKRLYHKFRAAPYYGGIATADAIGCSFLCAYCWSYARNEQPGQFGRFCSPEEVAETLVRIARRHGFELFRVTGSEPILGEASFHHLRRVIELVFHEKPGARFILETNGLILGRQPDFIVQLGLGRVLVRVAIKGVDPASFERVTGARADFFSLPLDGLVRLERAGIEAWPALMGDLFEEEEISLLRATLEKRQIRAELEIESLEPYPFVLANIQRRGLRLRAG